MMRYSYIILLVCGLLITVSLFPLHAYGFAAIWTDKSDYAPWETTKIYGSGFNPNTHVSLAIARPDLVVETRSTLSNSLGNFVYQYVLDGLRGTYNVTATDGTNSAGTSFGESEKIDWVQGLDDTNPNNGIVDDPMVTWHTGDINPRNSILTEGNTVPPYPPNIPGHINYRAIIDGLPAGHYVLTILYEFTRGGIVAIDFLTTNYGVTDSNLQTQLPNFGTGFPAKIAALVDSGPSTAIFPHDAYSLPSSLGSGTVQDRQIAHDTVFATYGARTMKLYGATITGVTQGTHDGSATGDSEANVAISFYKSTDDTQPVMATWGGHLGIGDDTPAGYGPGKGAGSVSGAPFHMTLESLVYVETGKNIIEGNRDRSIQVGAIIPPLGAATIVVEKITLGGFDTFNFVGTGTTPPTGFSSFSMTTETEGGSVSWGFANVNPGTYTVTEQPLTGWDLTGITITDPDKGSSYTGSAATLDVDAGEAVMVTFTNTKNTRASIDVTKSGPTAAQVGDAVTFTFTVTNTGDVPLATVSVVDSVAGAATFQSGDDDSDGLLDLTETWIFTVDWTVAASPDPLVNTATATGYYGGDAFTDTDTHSLDVAKPGIHVVKSGPSTAQVGEVVTFTFTVTNAGDVPLSIVGVVDSFTGTATQVSGDTNDNHLLDFTEAWVFTDTWTVAASPDPLENTATATGHYDGRAFTDTDSHSLDVLQSDIRVSKSGPLMAREGDVIAYTITISNPSFVTMTKVSVIDSLIGDVSESFSASLAPGASESRTFIYTVPSPSGNVLNYVTAIYKNNFNQEKTDSASWTVTVPAPVLYTVDFYTVPNNIGASIEFNDTIYIDGQSGKYAAGSYTVSANAPAGWSFDHWETTGGVTISTSAQVTGDGTITAVFLRTPALCTICDFVWKDLDRDGIQDVGEPGFSGVTVKLYNSMDNLVATTTTNGNGLYSFTVDPGSYYLEFVPPSGYALTVQDQGTDDAKDSDPDPSTHRTALLTVTSDQTDITRDAGMYPTDPQFPVGGEWVPVGRFSLLAPWIGLGSFTALITASFVYVKRKKKQMS